MARFRIIHHLSKEEWEVEAETPIEAREVVGWTEDICRVFFLQRGP
jgi:hypothetical protein